MLVIDDEPSILRALRINLTARNYEVSTASDGASGLLAVSRERPDAVILDLGLPDMDGTEVIHGVRGWSTTPIIVLVGLGRGAAEGGRPRRRRRRLRDQAVRHGRAARPAPRGGPPGRPGPGRAGGQPPPTSPSTWPPSGSSRDGADVRLTPTEWQLLEILARSRGRLITQKQLLQDVWGPSYGSESNYLRVYIAQLRRKLEPEPSRPRYLLTEPGMGYRFQA